MDSIPQSSAAERNRAKSNQELFEVVEAARKQNDFAGSLNGLSFGELRRIDKYLDQVMGANAEGTRDHLLWKQVRDELALRLVEKSEEIGQLAGRIGPKSKKLVGEMCTRVRGRVRELLGDLQAAA